jgi:hypothetical protein
VEEYHARKTVVPAYRSQRILGYTRKTFYKDEIDSESSSE